MRSTAEECRMPALEKEWEKSDFIFTAKVKKIEVSVYRKIAHVDVLRAWKGKIPTPLNVVMKIEDGGCSYQLEEGKISLIFSSAGDPAVMQCCSRTRLIDDASKDVAWLEEITSRRNPVPARDPFIEQQGDRNIQIPSQVPPKALSIYYAVVVGITQKGDKYTVLLRDANGKVHAKTAGDRLYDGKVLKVRSNSVTFVYDQGNRVVTKKLHPFANQ